MKKFLLLALMLPSLAFGHGAPVIWDGTAARWLPGGLKSAGMCVMSSTGVMTSGTVNLASSTYVTGVLPNANTTAASANTLSAIVARDGSGNFSAGTITAALSGNASTATALASNPSDCGAGEFASAIAANGNLTCSVPADTTGNAATATALAANPTDCGANEFATAIAANGNLTCAATSTIDHGALSGLSDDDHTQYVALAGRGTGGQTITDPVTIAGTSANQDLLIFDPVTGGNWAIGAQGNSVYWAQGAVTPLWFATGWTAMGNAARTPKYLIDVMESAASTAPATDLIYNSGTYNLPLITVSNRNTTASNWSGLAFAGSSSASSAPDSAIVGVHEVHTGSSETGRLEFYTRNAGTLAKWLNISSSGIHTMGAYGTGIAHFNSSGVISSSAVDLSGADATGTLAAARMPALTGDVTTSAGAVATTLATVNSNVGSFTNANITVNAKGLVTAAANGSAGSGSTSMRTFTAGWGNGTSPQNGCSASPCTLYNPMDSDGNTDTISSITRAGTGEYTMNVTSGRCSAVPACSFIQSRACLGSEAAAYNNSATPTSTAVPFVTDTSAGANGCGYIQCSCAK